MKALVAVAAVVVAGLLVLSLTDRWRLGAIVVGLAFCLGAVLRLTLPGGQVGELAVRSRWLDGAVLVVVGFGLVALANTIPNGH